MMKKHSYTSEIRWTGNLGKGTENYTAYARDFEVHIEGKPTLFASSDSAFRGDASRHNPEDLFLSSISSCHMLWYLHLCSEAGIQVQSYSDRPKGTMVESKSGKGEFVSVVLHPIVTIKNASQTALALELHHKANEFCFIANSVKFEIQHQAKVEVISL
jgi:organic hydroperoxide reductase OsmC/OhrA